MNINSNSIRKHLTTWHVFGQDFNLHTCAPHWTIQFQNSTNTEGSFSRGIKRPGRDADHSPPSSDEIKNEWSYASATPTHLHVVYRDKFTCSYFLCHQHSRFNRYTDNCRGICVLVAAARRLYSSSLVSSATQFMIIWRSLPLRCENGSHLLISSGGHANPDLCSVVSESSSGIVHDASTTTRYDTWSLKIPVNHADDNAITVSV
jgi:hypothetical protein